MPVPKRIFSSFRRPPGLARELFWYGYVYESYRTLLQRQRRELGAARAGENLVFHGTSLARWERIRHHGLLPRSERGWKTEPGLSFSLADDDGERYAWEAAERDDSLPVLLLLRIDPDTPAGAADDDFWEFTACACREEGDRRVERVLRDYAGERTPEVLALCEEARPCPTPSHQGLLGSMLPGGNTLRLSLAVRGQARLTAPLSPGAIQAAWRLCPGESPTPLEGTTPSLRPLPLRPPGDHA